MTRNLFNKDNEEAAIKLINFSKSITLQWIYANKLGIEDDILQRDIKKWTILLGRIWVKENKEAIWIPGDEDKKTRRRKNIFNSIRLHRNT